MRGKGKFVAALLTFTLMLFLASCGEEKCQHSWVYDEAGSKPATCIANGYDRYFCSKCSEQKDEPVISDETKHKVVEDSSLDEKNAEEKAKAKCGSQYNVYGKCKYCQKILVLIESQKASHKFNTYSIKYELIQDDGVINTQVHHKISGHTCDICGQWDSSDVTTESEEHNSNKKNENSITTINKALELGLCKYYENMCDCGYEFSIKVEHSWDQGEILKKPTCTEKGLMKYTCANVDCLIKTKQEEINQLGHDFNEADKDKDCISRFCNRCEQTITPTADHHYEYDFDCCDRVCTKCGYTILATLNHEYKDNYTCHDRYCMICNSPDSKKSATTDHEFLSVAHDRLDCTNAEEQYSLHCEICGDDVYKTFETSYNSHDRYMKDCKDPTCTENGYEIRGCTRCNNEERIELQALGHNYGGDVATCHDRTCIVCGHVEPHTTQHQLASDGTSCLACGDVIKLSKPIIYYDVPTKSLKVQGEATYIQYYLVNAENQRTPFNGNMSTYPVGVYSVCAKNTDVTGYYLESEESDILTVWVLKDNPLVNVEQYTNKVGTFLKVSLNDNTADVPYHLHVEFYNGDTKLGEKDYKNYKDGGLIKYTDMGDVTKVVITLMPPSDLNGDYAYDGIYTIEYIIPTE